MKIHAPPALPRTRLLGFVGAAYLAVSTVLRLALWGSFGAAAQVPLLRLPEILGVGAVNDAVELLYLLAPLSLYLLLLPGQVARKPWHVRCFSGALFLLFFGMLYLAVAEYFFFEEFNARFNLVAVDYLLYPHEVLVNLWDSYPVATVLALDAAVTAVLLRLLWPKLRRALLSPSQFKMQARWAGLHLVLLALAIAWFSTHTLAYSDNRVANELAANGVSSLFRAFRTNELDYSAFYHTLEPQRAMEILRVRLAGDEGAPKRAFGPGLTRRHAQDPAGLGRRNVVVIVEESLGAGYVGRYGDTRGLTPEFDRLAERGLLFRTAYATGTRTVRGLEAIVASFPPIPSEAILKRPGSEGIANWGEVMRNQGYQASFLYGGYSYFDNMQHFFATNGFEVRDRSDIPNPAFANIWGVSDEHLFRYAVGYFDAQAQAGTPFFSVVLTTSNHTPFTFPAGVPGVPPEGGGRKAGIRYADHALGWLLDEAPRHPWFANTVFVVVADHDARVYGRAQIPVQRYRIPLLVYAPGLVSPGEVQTPISQMDIAPTLLGLLGLEYQAPFFGQDVLHLPAGRTPPILLNHNHDVALLLGDRLQVLGLNDSTESYLYHPDEDSLERLPADKELLELATAYYQTAALLFRERLYR